MSERIDLFQVTELELVYHPKRQLDVDIQIDEAKKAQQVFRANWRKGTMSLVESFYVMFLNNSKNVIGLAEISRGGYNATVVDPRLVFGYAIKAAANSIIMAHNHPSGRLQASQADIHLTERLEAGGKILGINVDDHLILTPDGNYLSVCHQSPRPSPFN